MKIHVISDLHLEFAPLELPGGDLLILAGDVCEAKNFNLNHYDPGVVWNDYDPQIKSGNDRRRHNCVKFFMNELPKYRQVLYVLGNHEHYGEKLHKTRELIESRLIKAGLNNVIILEDEHIEIDGVVFVGSTLWTDCNKGDPLTVHSLRNSMNDYRCITYLYRDSNAYNKLRPEVTHRIHMLSKEYIAKTLKDNADKPAVVITHHAPSHLSIAPEFAGDYQMNGGFVSDLSNLILDNPNIKLWVHGHTHSQFDYMIGDTRVFCNPRGYAGYERISVEFNPGKEIDI